MKTPFCFISAIVFLGPIAIAAQPSPVATEVIESAEALVPIDDLVSLLRKKGRYIVNIRRNGEAPSISIGQSGISSVRGAGVDQIIAMLLEAKSVTANVNKLNQVVISPTSGSGLLATEIKDFSIGDSSARDAIDALSKASGVSLILMRSNPQADKKISGISLSRGTLIQAMDSIVTQISDRGWSATLTGLNDGFKPGVVIQLQ